MNRRLFLGMLLTGTSVLVMKPLSLLTKKVHKEKLLVYKWTDKVGNLNYIQSEIPLMPHFYDGNTVSHYSSESNVKIKAFIIIDNSTKKERVACFTGMGEAEARKFIKEKTGYEKITPLKL